MRLWPAGPAAFHTQPEQHGAVQAAKLHNRAGISLKKFRKDLTTIWRHTVCIGVVQGKKELHLGSN